MENFKIDTKCVQGGYKGGNGEPRTPQIVQSTTFYYKSSQQMANLFDLKEGGYFYSRLQNPTNDVVAKKICELEGGVAALLTSSGQAATFFALFNICSAGDHIVCCSAIYGGTVNLIAVTMKKMGISCTFVEPDCTEGELNSAFKNETKALFGESVSNPSLVVLDFDKFSKAAKKHGVPFIVDNTFPTPVNCRPFEHGADIVTHSTTKYMDGHGTAVGGAIVDSGNFDWDKYGDKFAGLTKPDDSYHGIVYTKTFGKGAYITKCVTQLMRDLGSIPAPQNSFLLNTHLESLHLRMERHVKNATEVAEFLTTCKEVAWVSYPGLKTDKNYALAQKYMPRGTCGVIAFGIKGGRAAATKFMDSLKLCNIATHVADAKTCVLYPAGTTHRQLTDEQLVKAGVSADLIRLSVGIENSNDIIDDLAQALKLS
jgi:O-acetylhomoserine (thiol)-lyase